MENQVCKSFALTGGKVTWDMSEMPQEKLKKNIKQLLSK